MAGDVLLLLRTNIIARWWMLQKMMRSQNVEGKGVGLVWWLVPARVLFSASSLNHHVSVYSGTDSVEISIHDITDTSASISNQLNVFATHDITEKNPYTCMCKHTRVHAPNQNYTMVCCICVLVQMSSGMAHFVEV